MAIIGKWALNGNANALVGSNGTATSVTWVDGKSNGAGSFNGTSSGISLGNIFNFTGTTPFSIEALIFYTGNAGYIITKFQPGVSGQWVFSVTSDNRITLSREVAPFGLTSSATLNLNQWNYIVGVYNGTSMSIYNNGILVAGPQNSGSIASNSVDVNIGKAANSSNFYNGIIDEVIVHNSTLTPVGIKNKALFYNGFI